MTQFGSNTSSGGGIVVVVEVVVLGVVVVAGIVLGGSVGTSTGTVVDEVGTDVVVADAADGPDALIGYAQTEDTMATLSYLRSVAADCVPLADTPCAASGRLPDNRAKRSPRSAQNAAPGV